MANFKFNFTSADINEDATISSSGNDKDISPEPTTAQEAKEIQITSNSLAYLDSAIEEICLGQGSFCLKHVNEISVDENLTNSAAIKTAAERSSDLIPSVYEGGLKIWECSIDLVDYMLESGIDFLGKRVLEIGCGAGLPGIYALLQGGQVHFQDYNDDVIEHVTIPNVLLNLEQRLKREHCDLKTTTVANFDLLETVRQSCSFYSGDWGNLLGFINPELATEMLYDVILTAETIYAVESHVKLYQFVKRHLKKPSGLAYVAAKTHYFGVGGGTRSFEKLVLMDGVFDVSVCKVYSTGVQREILCLKYR
ncbi:histidine protein methyltransferase 1 homolog [Stylophora pistillata]|uniref:histidine protein methyltransferase 1 homolog n=1 Tax=Stylophora pistillata TaxID=50429 RepID=UPI000C039A24|nr:histidine protein methyltransferase 1 homolog [Stylophora pistillata]